MGSRAVGAAVRRRSRDAHPAGDHPRHRRRARAEGARHRTRPSFTSTKATRRSSSCSASAISSSTARASTTRSSEIRQTTVFTTHTPVPAGHDAFPFHLVEKHLAGCWGTLGAEPRSVPRARRPRQRRRPAVQHDGARAALGRQRQRRQPAARRGDARDVGADLAGRRRGRAARVAVTNGVHVPTWIAARPRRPVRRAPRRRLARSPRRPGAVGRRARRFPTRSSGPCASRCARYLFTFIRERARQRWTDEHVGTPRVVAAGTLLDPDALTIGFARRFTGYKRPELIFHDAERLARILNAADRPVQIIFAGKSHPADDIGKHHLQRVYRRALDPAVRRPRRVRRRLRSARRALPRAGLRRLAEHPAQAARGERHERHEGGDQRRAAPEHRRRLVGRRLHRQQRLADRRRRRPATTTTPSTPPTRNALYRLLEEEVVPAFYDRDADGVPRRWLAIVKESIRTVAPRFSARRMVKEYAERCTRRR